MIDNLINQLSDRSKIAFNSAYKLAVKNNEVFTSNHILFILLDDLEKYIKDILIKLFIALIQYYYYLYGAL